MSTRTDGKIGALFGRVKEVCRGRGLLLLAGVLGLVLLVLGACRSQSLKNSGKQETDNGVSVAERYRAQLESEAEELCRRVKGVGDVKVAVTLEVGESYTYSGSHVTSTIPPRVCGVAVVCDGGASDTVKRELTELFTALYHIGANRVHISPMK